MEEKNSNENAVSEKTFSKVYAALTKAQGEFPKIELDGENAYFSSKYATLANILHTVRPVLAKHGLGIVQQTLPRKGAEIALRTMLIHESGESIECDLEFVLSKPGPHAFGAALTYLRRYTLQCILGIAAEPDDDGNAAAPQDDGNIIAKLLKELQEESQKLGMSEVAFQAWLHENKVNKTSVIGLKNAIEVLKKARGEK